MSTLASVFSLVRKCDKEESTPKRSKTQFPMLCPYSSLLSHGLSAQLEIPLATRATAVSQCCIPWTMRERYHFFPCPTAGENPAHVVTPSQYRTDWLIPLLCHGWGQRILLPDMNCQFWQEGKMECSTVNQERINKNVNKSNEVLVMTSTPSSFFFFFKNKNSGDSNKCSPVKTLLLFGFNWNMLGWSQK